MKRVSFPVMARLGRLGCCSKSAAIWGTPVVPLTRSGRQPVTHNGPRAGDQKLGDEKPEFLQLQGDGAASSLPSAIAPHGHSLQAAADEPGLPTANEMGSARPNRSTNIVLNESSLGTPQAQITDQGARAPFRLQATLEMECCPRGPDSTGGLLFIGVDLVPERAVILPVLGISL